MSITEGKMFLGPDGKAYHFHFDDKGPYTDPDTGKHYDLVQGFTEPNPNEIGNIPQPIANPTMNHGPVVTPPPVPGGHGHPGKGVTVVNTKAMKTFASNIGGLVAPDGPLSKALAEIGKVNVKAGGFHSAVTLNNVVNGDGGMRGGAMQTLTDMIQVLTGIAEAMAKVANHYEKAEDLNAMTSADYATYLGEAGGYINSMGSGQQK